MPVFDEEAGARLCNRLLDIVNDYDYREFVRVLHQAKEFNGLYDLLDSLADHDWEL